GTEGKRTAEGEVLVTVQDVVFGRIYRYEETIDLGIDSVYFRKELDFALDLALRIEIAAMEILEPELDFEPVRVHARKVVLPQISRGLLAIHTHLAWLAADGLTLDERILDPEQLDRDPRVRVILAELRKLGLTREEGLHGELIEIITNGWRVDERVWLGWLEPLKGATRERKLDLRKRLLASFEHDEKSKLQERALEKTVAPDERDAVQERLMKLVYAGLGALTLHEFLDDHQIRLRVRLPGRVLLTDGHLHDLPNVEWRIETYQLVNPRVFACSFLPSDKMVGRIRDVQALFRFAQYMDPLDEKERAEITRFLQAAKKDGLAKTNETFLKGGDRKFELLSRVLVEE
ncbi:MAG: hypothetical protein ACYS0E_13725, partial [Planctomycetota bacterium]